jgi:hypothetical protein
MLTQGSRRRNLKITVRFSESTGGECTIFNGKGKENHELGTGSYIRES